MHNLLLNALLPSIALALVACQEDNAAFQDSKTDWLAVCDESSECGEGLSCICGTCTQECNSDSDCQLADAACLDTSALGGACGASSPPPSICLQECTENSECPVAFECNGGACLPEPRSANSSGSASVDGGTRNGQSGAATAESDASATEGGDGGSTADTPENNSSPTDVLDGGVTDNAENNSDDSDDSDDSGTSDGNPADGDGNTADGDGNLPRNDRSSCTQGIAQTSQIPLLSNLQYDRTIQALLGVTSLLPSNSLGPSNLLTEPETGSISIAQWQGYQAAAQAVAAQVMTVPAQRERFMTCSAEENNAECLHKTIIAFGRRAFRRPLTANEVERFDAIVAQGKDITENGSPEELAEVVLETFLSSASFLQRSEITEQSAGEGVFSLSSYEVASRLSYLLWDSMPDETLSLAADSDELREPAQILAQAQRLLQAPLGHAFVQDFHSSYLRMGPNSRWSSIQKDAVLFPLFRASLVPTINAATQKFLEHIVFSEQGSFQDLLLSPAAFVTSETAAIYGLNASEFDTELQEISLDPETRPGVLTRLGFLSAFGRAERTSPILRGEMILRQILGIDVGGSPSAATSPPEPLGAPYDTNRERVTAQTDFPACAECHQPYLDPPGFVLEAFDSIGALQSVEADTGAPIDTAAEVYIDGSPVTVADPSALMALLAASEDAQYTYAQRWVNYAYKRDRHVLDSCTVSALGAKVTAGGYRIQDLITDLTLTDSFRNRTLLGGPR